MTSRGNSEKKSFTSILILALALVLSGSAWAQDDAAEEEESADLDRIAVTGSRIKRADLEGPAPVLIISQQDMSERGYTTVYEALQDLTINNGFKFEGAESALFTPDVQTINLRGFGVGTTLTLINGRRLANYPGAYQSNTTVFSYGSIPVAAIERIEILSVGASAIYGSDAVAGVVNIILRNDIDETTVNVLWGTPTGTHSTRGDTRIQLLNGKTFNRGSYTFTAEYVKRKSISGADYDQYDNQEEDYPYGRGVYNRTLLTLDQFKSAFGVFPRYRDPAVSTGLPRDQACAQSNNGHIEAWRPGAGWFCGDPQSGVPETNFQNKKEAISLYFNGVLEIGNSGTEIFTDLLYYDSKSESGRRTMWVFEDILDVTQPDTIGFGFFDWYAFQRGFNEEDLGMDLAETFDDQAYTISGGIRGIFADVHDWELNANYSKNKVDSQRPWFTWDGVINNMLGTWHGVSFFGDSWWSGGTLGEDISFGLGLPENLYGQVNQDVIDSIGIQNYGNETTDLFIQYTMSGDLMEMNAGPLSYALVAEYEKEDLKFIPDDLVQQRPPTQDSEGNPITGLVGSGWYNLTGYSGDGDRKRWSVGAELRVPLHETFTVNLAARYDDYDSGSTSYGGDVVPSISLEWRPVDSFLARAGYTESFRAPDMAQVFVRTGFFTGATDFVSCYEQYVFQNGSDDGFSTSDCDSTTIFANRVGPQDFGAEPLDAETGDTMWIGFSWDIMDNLSLTVDYTKVKLEQRVAQQSTQGLLDDDWACFNGDAPETTPCDQVSNQVIRMVDPTTGLSFIDEFFVTSINQQKEEGSYIDVKLVYTLNTEYGMFRFQGDYNNVLDHTLQIDDESDPIDLKNDPVQGGWDFRSSFIGSLTWNFRDFSTTASMIYRGSTAVWRCTRATNGCVGEVTGDDYLSTGNYRVDPYITWNLTASYNWTDEFMTRLRVVNLFDEKPPWDDTSLFFDNPWYNIYVYPGAGIGRYAAIEAQYTWQ